MSSAKHDIQTREDVILLVNSFYEKVRENDTIGFIFDEVAKVDWEHHLPRMYNFWCSILLGEHSFSGNPMVKHIALSRQTTLSSVQFAEWLNLFKNTVDHLFDGRLANEAKMRAENIAQLMLFKIQT